MLMGTVEKNESKAEKKDIEFGRDEVRVGVNFKC